jgi:hypothetical protein
MVAWKQESCKREKTEREELGFYQRSFNGTGEYRAARIVISIGRWRKEKELKL